MKLYQPQRHRSVEACAVCRQPWPCADERARIAGAEAGRAAVDRAIKAARLMPKIEERTEGVARG